MSTLARLQAFETERDALLDLLHNMAKQIAEVRGNPLDRRATYPDDWDIYDGHVSVNYSYYVCGCCGPETTSVSFISAYLDDPAYLEVERASCLAEQERQEAEEDERREAAVRMLV